MFVTEFTADQRRNGVLLVVIQTADADLEMFGMGHATASGFNNGHFVDLNITDFGSPLGALMGMGDGTFIDATAASGADLTVR